MISYIRGELVAVEEEKAVIDVGGVGYGIFMPAQSMGKLPPLHEEVRLHTYLHVKEDAMQLYGFLTRDDLKVFKLVIGVSGIGPKGALNILSNLSADDLRFAVLSNDVKAISAAQGIGKKTAEKLIIELKDKLSMDDVLEHMVQEEEVAVTGQNSGVQAEAVQALVALGYGNTESLRAVRRVEVNADSDVETVLKQALRFMM
ncbi:Holliday junction DNA helicase RuvA [Lachnospiraceae bacterium 2_1_46FAA]|nr:Holliday junction DNA helicase RuvA [Lachnospiraceae bacterium 2_1_46FAA]